MPIATLRLWLLLLLTLLGGSAQAQRLAAGWRHTLSIHADGTLWAWGSNSYGQLGIGTTTQQNRPVQVGSATNWRSVSTGYYFTVALKTDGTLWAWGQNANGQLGQGTTGGQQTQPVQVGTATNWASVSASDYHIVAIKADGSLWGWGQNFSGQLGLGTTNVTTNTPTQVGTATWRAVSGGSLFTLAIRTDGTLWSWGTNGNGQLGNGTSSNAAQPTPTQVGTATTWQAVSAGAFHGLALQTNGTLWAWGFNGWGALGSPAAPANQLTPLQVGTATTWRSVSAGYSHSAAVRADGTLWAWGDNRYSQLGDGTTTQQNAPVQVATGANWQTVSAGQFYTTALRQDNSYWAWGYHSNGQLGNGRGPQLIPYELTTPDTWRGINAGAFHTLAIGPNSTLWSWGSNTAGQLGNGTTTDQRQPTQIGAPTVSWRTASGGYTHSAAISLDGTLWTWGDNSAGELGDGTTTSRLVPTQLGTATDWASVSTGYQYTLALKTDGSLWAWGRNNSGQLGLGTTTQQTVPTRVGTATWQSVTTSKSAGTAAVSLAIRQDGTLWAWGSNNNGQLGQGTYSAQSTAPVQVGTATWQSAAASSTHTLGVRTDGTLWAWGLNNFGQLGTGLTPTITSVPVQVGSSSSWNSVTAGFNTSAALRNRIELFIWGSNVEGQLGDGTTTDQATPQSVGGSNILWQSVSLGFYHTVAMRANPNGTIWLWGDNRYNQLTLSNTTPLPTYVPNAGGIALAAAPASTAPAWYLAPNPAHGRAQLAGLPTGPVAGQLFDAQGRLVRTTSTATVALEGLAPGLYLLRATTGGATRTLRLAVE
jgi:alpha-tubulin suppressor-like RCC1 family protein